MKGKKWPFTYSRFFQMLIENFLEVQSAWCGYLKAGLDPKHWRKEKIRIIRHAEKKIALDKNKIAHKELLRYILNVKMYCEP